MLKGHVARAGEFPSNAHIHALGELCFLFLRAPGCETMTLAALRKALEPATDTGQFAMMRQDGVPRAALTWAYLSEGAEARFMAGQTLTSDDWVSGDRVWIMDLVAPYGKNSGPRLVREWEQTLSADTMAYNFVRTLENQPTLRRYVARRQPNGRFRWHRSLIDPTRLNHTAHTKGRRE